MGRPYEAISAYKQSQSIAKELGADYTLKDIFKGLASSYAAISDFKNAFEFQQLYDVVKDSIYNVETDDKIKNLQFSYKGHRYHRKRETRRGVLRYSNARNGWFYHD